VVAFPQNTVLSYPDCPVLLEQALEMGADVVGGIPHNEATREDGVASLRIIFELAEKYGVPVDVHCDEIDDEQSRFVEDMAALVSKFDLDAPVNGAQNLGITDRYGIEEGKPADCIVLDCVNDQQAVQHQSAVLCSIHNGRTVFVRQPASYTTTMDGFAGE
jgi:cytosine/adenosine deaminase-related metal-dependent hydrolase